MRELWNHQKYALNKFKDRTFSGLLFPCGTGKTATATRIAEETEKPVLTSPRLAVERVRKELGL